MSSRRNRNIQPDGNNNGNNNGGNANNINGQQPNMNNLGQLLNNIDLNQVMGQLSQMMGSSQGGPPQPQRPAPHDPRLDLLQAMKPFLGGRRGAMIDRIGQLYAIARILQNNNRRR